MSDAPCKKKSPPVALPRALEEGLAPRPLFPAHRVGIPVGLVAIGAIAFLELSPAAIRPDSASCGTKPSIFERGAEAAKLAFDRITGNAYMSPGRGSPAVAGGAMAMDPPPVGTTTPTHLGAFPSTTVPLADDMVGASPEPDTRGAKTNKKYISPGTHQMRPAGAGMALRPPHRATVSRGPGHEEKQVRALEKQIDSDLEKSLR